MTFWPHGTRCSKPVSRIGPIRILGIELDLAWSGGSCGGIFSYDYTHWLHYRPPSWSSSSCVTWVNHTILLDDRWAWLSQVLMIATHNKEFASWGKRYQTSLIFSSRPLEANFSPKICRTHEEAAELIASRGILLSSFLHVCGGLKGVNSSSTRTASSISGNSGIFRSLSEVTQNVNS